MALLRKNKRKLRRKKEPVDVDITSLLDILTILLVFLLKSYNASDLTLEVAEKITLPDSRSRELGNHSVIVQVGEDRSVWINNTKIGVIGSGEKIDVLYGELLKYKETEKAEFAKRIPAQTGTPETENKKINIVMDQSIPYDVLRRVMHTSALAGYPEFKFIVQGNF
jgi:biopolymer transport protein ExbD